MPIGHQLKAALRMAVHPREAFRSLAKLLDNVTGGQFLAHSTNTTLADGDNLFSAPHNILDGAAAGESFVVSRDGDYTVRVSGSTQVVVH